MEEVPPPFAKSGLLAEYYNTPLEGSATDRQRSASEAGRWAAWPSRRCRYMRRKVSICLVLQVPNGPPRKHGLGHPKFGGIAPLKKKRVHFLPSGDGIVCAVLRFTEGLEEIFHSSPVRRVGSMIPQWALSPKSSLRFPRSMSLLFVVPSAFVHTFRKEKERSGPFGIM